METITIHRTTFIGPGPVRQAKKIIGKIEFLKGEWYIALVIKRNKEAIELLMIEDGKITDASYHRGIELQEAVELTKRTEKNFMKLEVT